MAGLRRHRGASFIVLGPCVVLRWRRAANIGITVLVVIRLFVSYNLPGTLIMARVEPRSGLLCCTPPAGPIAARARRGSRRL
jgi:hypothetical protein